MISELRKPINISFGAALLLFLLVIFQFVPREVIYLPALIVLAYILFANLQNSTVFFIRFIPFFFALPITSEFDNFNLWRIAVLVLFLRWVFQENKLAVFISYAKNPILWCRGLWHENRVEFLGLLLFVFAVLSLSVADNPLEGLKRIIYFVNMLALLFVVRDLIRKDKGYLHRVAYAFLTSGMLALALGYMQWISAYFVPAWQWHYWWGQIVSLNMYGKGWADVVTNSGNTWFSYSGGGLRLRMFSLFPDSHSFPLYLIMILPSFFLLFRKHILWLLALFLMFGALVLSGTRGIWVSIFFPAVVFVGIWIAQPDMRKLIKPLLLIFAMFIAVFILAWGVLFLPQFKESTASSSRVFIDRVGSLLDFGETSNVGRIIIWQKTLISIGEKPLLGVGIGNFPTILKQNISASKAGSSAHNIFLHIAAEMGVGAFLVLLWFFRELIKRAWRMETLFSLATLLALVWIMGYLLTDAALFDGRAFLGFMVFLGMIFGITRKNS